MIDNVLVYLYSLYAALFDSSIRASWAVGAVSDAWYSINPGNTIIISKTLVTAVPDPRPGLRHRHAPSAFSDSVRVSMSLCPVSCRVGDSVCAAGLLHVCAPAQPRAKYHILAALRVSHRDGLLLRHAAFGDVRRAHAGRAPHAI